MRGLIFTILCFCIAFGAHAQSKGNKLIHTNLGFSYKKEIFDSQYDSTKRVIHTQQSAHLSVLYGYFLSDRFMIGLSLFDQFSYERTVASWHIRVDEVKRNIFSYGAVLRYYYRSPKEKWRPFIQWIGSNSFRSSIYSASPTTIINGKEYPEYKKHYFYTDFNSAGALGISLLLSKKVNIEGMITMDLGGYDISSGLFYGGNSDLSGRLGFSYFF